MIRQKRHTFNEDKMLNEDKMSNEDKILRMRIKADTDTWYSDDTVSRKKCFFKTFIKG